MERRYKTNDGQYHTCKESTNCGVGVTVEKGFRRPPASPPLQYKKSLAYQAHGIKVNSKHQSQHQSLKSNPSIKVNFRHQSQAPKSTHVRKSIPGTNLKA